MIVNVIEMACGHPLYYHYITVYIIIIIIYVCCVYHCQVTSLFFKQIYLPVRWASVTVPLKSSRTSSVSVPFVHYQCSIFTYFHGESVPHQ
jgi:hypothetical protein